MSDTRRRILSSLIKEPKHISELARELEKDRSTIAYHLSKLKKTGLVTSEYKLINEITSPGTIGNYLHVNMEVLREAVEEARKAVSLTGA